MTIKWDRLVKYGIVANMDCGNGGVSEPFRRTIYGYEMTTGASTADGPSRWIIHAPLSRTVSAYCSGWMKNSVQNRIISLYGMIAVLHIKGYFLYSCFRASQLYVNKCPTRRNNMQSIFYFNVRSLYMFRVPSTPIIRSTWNCSTATGTSHVSRWVGKCNR